MSTVVRKLASLVKSARVMSVRFKSAATIVPLVISVLSMATPKLAVKALPVTERPVPEKSVMVSPPKVIVLPVKRVV